MTTYLTKAGVIKLETELKELTRKKWELSREVGIAREHGDLRENAEYQTAKERLAQLMERIGDIQFKLSNVQVVDPTQHKKGIATMGTKVRVRDLKAKSEETYLLVGPDESDPAAGKISVESPLGRAFLGRKVKEKVTATLPSGPRPFQILGIELAG